MTWEQERAERQREALESLAQDRADAREWDTQHPDLNADDSLYHHAGFYEREFGPYR